VYQTAGGVSNGKGNLKFLHEALENGEHHARGRARRTSPVHHLHLIVDQQKNGVAARYKDDTIFTTFIRLKRSYFMSKVAQPARTLELDNKHVFISYSHLDRLFVDRLSNDLHKAGVRFWRDEQHLDRLLPSFARQIPAAIRRAYVLVLIASPDCAESVNVSEEILMAKSENVPILAVWSKGDIWIKCVPFGYGIGLQYYEDLRGERYETGCKRTVGILKGEQVPGAPFTEISSSETHTYQEVRDETSGGLLSRLKTAPLRTPMNNGLPFLQVVGGRYQREMMATLDMDAAEGKFIIGRESHADIVIHPEEESVSRVHAAITFNNGRYYITDSSRNGTWVQRNILPRHEPTLLKNGDEIILGEAVKLRFWTQQRGS